MSGLKEIHKELKKYGYWLERTATEHDIYTNGVDRQVIYRSSAISTRNVMNCLVQIRNAPSPLKQCCDRCGKQFLPAFLFIDTSSPELPTLCKKCYGRRAG